MSPLGRAVVVGVPALLFSLVKTGTWRDEGKEKPAIIFDFEASLRESLHFSLVLSMQRGQGSGDARMIHDSTPSTSAVTVYEYTSTSTVQCCCSA